MSRSVADFWLSYFLKFGEACTSMVLLSGNGQKMFSCVALFDAR
ncbi:MAG: hypothetical protein ACMUEK_01815 [Sodalis sp. (in: enterobacteria)]